MSAVCVCTTGLVKINKSVCHLYALFDRHNTVHLGAWRNISSASIKFHPFFKLGEKTETKSIYMTNIELWFVPLLNIANGDFFSRLKCWQSSSNRYPSNGVIPILHNVQNTTHSAHCNTGQSVWTVPRKFCYQCMSRNECREGGQWVDGGWWRVCGGGDLLEKSSGWLPPAEAVWQRISLIPVQLEAFLWPVSPDVSENWCKKCSFKKSFWSCWWELGKACYTHSQSHHAIAYRLTVLWSACISIGRANKILHIRRGAVCVAVC